MKKLNLIIAVLTLICRLNVSAQINQDCSGRIGIGGTPTSKLHLFDVNTLVKFQNGNNNIWSIGNYTTGPWSAPNSLNICDNSGYPKMTFGQEETYLNDRFFVGTGYSGNKPAIQIAHQKYMMFNTAGNNKSGIMFLETGTFTASTAQYGAKIEYDGLNDALVLGTYQNNTANNSIFISRQYGGVGIGGTNTSSVYKLYVHGRAITTHSIWETSDIRVKEDIRDISIEKSKLTQLRGVSYTKKQEEKENSKAIVKNLQVNNTPLSPFDSIVYPDLDSVELKKPVVPEREYGFVAQEVKEIFPDLVIEDEVGFLAINYIGFIPLIIESYKEQQTKIENLEREIARIKNNTKSAANLQVENQISTLFQNSPNPFSESTEIKYFLDENVSKAMINIYNMNGTQLKSIQLHQRGDGSITINGNEFKAGMYMYTLIADGQVVDTKQMILTN
jgi:hypothetical protein